MSFWPFKFFDISLPLSVDRPKMKSKTGKNEKSEKIFSRKKWVRGFRFFPQPRNFFWKNFPSGGLFSHKSFFSISLFGPYETWPENSIGQKLISQSKVTPPQSGKIPEIEVGKMGERLSDSRYTRRSRNR